MISLFSVVTGCTEGIGEAFARELGRRGCNVALVARNEVKMRQIAQEIGKVQSPLHMQTFNVAVEIFLFVSSHLLSLFIYSNITKLRVIMFRRWAM